MTRGIVTLFVVVAVGVAIMFVGPGPAGDGAPVQASGAPSSSTAPPTSTTSTPPVARTATMAFTGDVLPHSAVSAQAAANHGGGGYDFAPMFALVEPVVAAVDLAICHLETPLSPESTAISGYPTFNAPAELSDALRGAGFDGCSTASNHAYDRGRQGVIDTRSVLDGTVLGAAGTAVNEIDGATPTLYDTGSVVVGHLSYTYGLNGSQLPAEEPWLVDLIDADAIISEARRARDAGAEYVVVSLHWGTEYQQEPTAEQQGLAEQLLAHPAVDLIIGHHAHVVQPVARVGRERAAYGLGNFLSNQSGECCPVETQDGVILIVTVTELDTGAWRTRLAYVPTWVDRSDYTIVPAGRAGAGIDSGVPATVLAASTGRTTEALTAMGVDVPEWSGP